MGLEQGMKGITKINVFNYSELPDYVKSYLRDRHNFHNDTMFELVTELQEFTMNDIESWRSMVAEEDGMLYEDTDQFCVAMGLTVERYLIDTYRFEDPTLPVWINVCW